MRTPRALEKGKRRRRGEAEAARSDITSEPTVRNPRHAATDFDG
jgi:hypothetical protein